ncbi:MAG TPA: hypothetical protein VHZ54_15510 [Solirubrobacterales bacterium]|nr:hypothetical protein [Solirubrobacterales bacterium]
MLAPGDLQVGRAGRRDASAGRAGPALRRPGGPQRRLLDQVDGQVRVGDDRQMAGLDLGRRREIEAP